MELWEDGYQGDVIGEYTQDVLVTEIIWRNGIMSLAEMKGERGLIEQIFQTEIIIFRALCVGSAVMQHMEDFYYISQPKTAITATGS
ncbi:hypothetical protein V6N13_089633 [Hibiscus sabdariffa]|uniref:Uncharacterized protein n=1 Tax=Hibiscus sabdariffa TaxID=183260 RepID=A0ABR2QJC3_9ROSI